MLGKSRIALVVGIAVWLIPCTLFGQNLDILPTATINRRFYTDVFFQNKPDSGIYPTKHPGLTLNGFNNGGDNGHGYGPAKTWQVCRFIIRHPLMNEETCQV